MPSLNRTWQSGVVEHLKATSADAIPNSKDCFTTKPLMKQSVNRCYPMHNVPVTNKLFCSSQTSIHSDNKVFRSAFPAQVAHNKQLRGPNGRRPPIGNTPFQLATQIST